MTPSPRLVLASGSKARRAMLEETGIGFEIVKSGVDESALMQAMAGRPAAEIAAALAQEKALSVSMKNQGVLAIGGDQVLTCGGRIYSKAADVGEARCNLLSLRGKIHDLVSAVCVAQGGKVIWSHCDTARMTMRDFDDAFLESYMASAGDALTSTVGGYEIEGCGKALFEKAEGDHWTIMGMPFAALKDFLREKGFLS